MICVAITITSAAVNANASSASTPSRAITARPNAVSAAPARFALMRHGSYLHGMSARSILAATSLLFVLQAPYPGELAGEPADASAEIAVSRATACSGSRDVAESTPSWLAAATAPDLEIVFHTGVEAPGWTRSGRAPRADRLCLPLSSRPPPTS
jgi:hypothetical protein